MAEKGFGVKEINLIGPSGTPTIESPNNLNLNAVNVAISTNVSIGGTLTVTGSVSVGGTLTYEDVTNIDSIGIITARSDIKVGTAITLTSAGAGFYAGIVTASDFVKVDGTSLGGGGSGISTISGVVSIANDLDVDGHTNLDNVSISGLTTTSGYLDATSRLYFGKGTGTKYMYGSGTDIKTFLASEGNFEITLNASGGTGGTFIVERNSGNSLLEAKGTGVVDISGDLNVTGVGNSVTAPSLYGDGQKIEPRKIYPTTSALNINYKIPFVDGSDSYEIPYVDQSGFTYNPSTNVLTAGTFSGSGANLTNLPAANLTGSLPAISGANLTNLPTTSPDEAPVINYSITSNGASAYRFTGGGVVSSEDNPDLFLVRGQTYRFNNTTGSNHPFAIRSVVTNSGGTDYTNGVTGSQNGVQLFTVPLNAPSKIHYQCTIHTSGMQGDIYISGGDGANEKVGITTFMEGISLDHASSSTHYKIENDSSGRLLFARSNGTVDLSIGPNGQLGLGGASSYGSIGQVARSTVSSSIGNKQPEWASALYYPSILREMTPTSNAISYNSIPSWVEKITILFHKVSLSGGNNIYVKLQNSGGTISSGYNSFSCNGAGGSGVSRNDSFVIATNSGSHTCSGKMEIHKIDNNGLRWVSTHMTVKLDNNVRSGAGDLTIASGGAVTGYYIEASGTNNFDGDSRISIILQ